MKDDFDKLFEGFGEAFGKPFTTTNPVVSKTIKINLSGNRGSTSWKLIRCFSEMLFTGKTSLQIKTKLSS